MTRAGSDSSCRKDKEEEEMKIVLTILCVCILAMVYAYFLIGFRGGRYTWVAEKIMDIVLIIVMTALCFVAVWILVCIVTGQIAL